MRPSSFGGHGQDERSRIDDGILGSRPPPFACMALTNAMRSPGWWPGDVAVDDDAGDLDADRVRRVGRQEVGVVHAHAHGMHLDEQFIGAGTGCVQLRGTDGTPSRAVPPSATSSVPIMTGSESRPVRTT